MTAKPTISGLMERPDFFAVVADRIWQAWWLPGGAALADVETALQPSLTDHGEQATLVAHDENGNFLGTTTIVPSDMEDRPQYTPWIAALWVEPEARGQGIAELLMEAARQRLFASGRERVYLCAKLALRPFYLQRGWTLIEESGGANRLDVFVCHRPAPPDLAMRHDT